ncbi:MAG: phosphonate transport system ATP-binding protein [Kiritimatiellia bacterium]|jgi:phosphonate transport system ATP-binding protein
MPNESSGGFQLQSVTIAFGPTTALNALSLDIRPGERVALVGPSGGGKSTLLNSLVGAVSPQSGTVWSLGEDLSTLSTRRIRTLRSQVGFIHQQLHLVPNLRVIQNVVCGRLGKRSFWQSARDLLYTSSADTEKVYQLLLRVGIPEKLYQRTDQLSGGQQQRVAIARALFPEPKALLADEPVSSIDPARARDLVDLLTSIAAEQQLTLVMSIHNLELAKAYFPRLVGLRHGLVAFDKQVEEITAEDFNALYDLSQEELLT